MTPSPRFTAFIAVTSIFLMTIMLVVSAVKETSGHSEDYEWGGGLMIVSVMIMLMIMLIIILVIIIDNYVDGS